MHTVHSRSISREDLDRVLAGIVDRHFGGRPQLASWRRRVTAYSSSWFITSIRLELATTNESFQLAFKNLTPGSQLPTARRVRPDFLYRPEREILTYERILGPLNLGTARFLGAEVDPQLPRCWLFLEWVKGPLLWQLGRIRHWQQAARWLATLHHETLRLDDLENHLKPVHPLSYDARAYANWMARAEAVLGDTLLRDDRRAAREFAKIVRRYDRVIQRLCQLPKTLVHSEFFPANIVMRWTGTEHRVCPIDWELTGWGPGALDLAALAAGDWSATNQRKILCAYHEASADYDPSGLTLGELQEAVTCCQLHLCLRHLGWATRWRPQGQQARKWLANAFALAGQLGL